MPRVAVDAAEAPSINIFDGLAAIPGTAMVVPGWYPFDLGGRTVTFTPQGASYAASVTQGASSADRGTELELPGPDFTTRYGLGFAFPFFGEHVTDIYVTWCNGIHFAPPQTSSGQFTEFSVLNAGPVLSPYLTTRNSQGVLPSVNVKASAEAVTITWASNSPSSRYEIRATLVRDGTISYSYVNVEHLPAAGAVVLTSGKEPWRSAFTTVGETADPEGDLPKPAGVPAAKLKMMDIVKVRALRLAESNWIRFEITLAGPIDLTLLDSDETIQYWFDTGLQFGLWVDKTGITYTQTPTYGEQPVAALNGNTVIFDAPQDGLKRYASAGTLAVEADTLLMHGKSGILVDAAAVSFPFAPPKSLRTDFAATHGETMNGPIVEAFTVGRVEEGAVWNLLKSRLSLKDEDWDAVAIYSDFPTDIQLLEYNGYSIAAYAIGGNAGVDGIGDRSTTKTIRSPTMLNMNVLPPTVASLPAHPHILLHEFGHRWLFQAKVAEETKADILCPDGVHPAQWVDTRAAFPVASSLDSSVMGGGTFIDEGDGTFSTATNQTATALSYSWLDLYLMGLAAADEVPPFFYVADSNPALGSVYYPPPGTYHGTRKDVAVSQVVKAMGPRTGPQPTSFRVAFVLIYNPLHAPSDEEKAVLATLRSRLVEDFKIATGGRGELTASLPDLSRRRAAGH